MTSETGAPSVPLRFREVALVLAVALLAAFVHYLPHLPGQEPATWTDVPDALVDRASKLSGSGDYPYPVHVDEHYHLAVQAAINRSADVQAEPYVAAPPSPLFSVGGMRAEKGFEVAIVQIHQLTGIDLPALHRFLPAAQSAFLAVLLWAFLRPAPGAVAAAAFTVLLPTTVRFLGVGFLVPSSFALAWILAVALLALRARGPGRLAGLALLVTGAFFMHLVVGTLALVAGLLASLAAPGTRGDRIGVALALLAPLIFILPANAQDALDAVSAGNGLPFSRDVFRAPGVAFLAVAVAGVAVALLARPARLYAPHRVLAGLAVFCVLLMAWSFDAGHHNDATYSRLLGPLFLALAGLAGGAVGWLAGFVRGHLVAGARLGPLVHAAAATVVVLLLVPGLQAALATPYYRVFDETSWEAGPQLAAAGAAPGDWYLSHPWRAPVYSAFTGASPHTVLIPGSPPERAADFQHYIVTQGANPDWWAGVQVDWAIGPYAPNATHVRHNAVVHELQ